MFIGLVILRIDSDVDKVVTGDLEERQEMLGVFFVGK